MKDKRKLVLIGTLVVLAILIHLFSSDALRVEHYYSTGIYPSIAIFLRYLFGWLPVSIGDILYGVVIGWLLFKIIRSLRALATNRLQSSTFIARIYRLLTGILLMYICFNLLWGINYNRKGIASQLGLILEKYSVNEVKELNEVLLQKVNESSNLLRQLPPANLTSKEIFDRSVQAYRLVNQQYPFLTYHPVSIKTSLWGWLGNYVGFLGYYNPFTGEGQVNTGAPKFLQPYTNCHEIAHQLGYAKENEANFVGYLAAVASKDESFHYSVYLDLFLYANRNLYQTDTAAAKAFSKQLLPAVRQDLNDWRKFNEQHKNLVEPLVHWMYGKYLESNQQPAGILSYDEVTGFMIAYYKKFGKL